MSQKSHNRITNIYNTYLKFYGINKFTVLVIVLSIIFHFKFDDLIQYLGDLVEKYQNVLSVFRNDNVLNIASYLLLILGAIYLFYLRWNNKNISINKLIVTVFFAVSLYKLPNDFEFYPLGWKVSYKELVLLITVVYIVVFLIKLYEQYKVHRKILSNKHVKELENVGWDDYINNLSTTILKNNLTSESFSLGIIGGWGSGKTTFLRSLENLLIEKAYVINFNPWNSHSENQITSDFFNTLITELKPFYSGLSKPLKQYSDLLVELDLDSSVTRVSKFLSSGNSNSLDNLKIEVENCLLHFEKPIVVIIDDLDRLSGDEILEVFKLIRNSAQLKNIAYIVAYDKSYIKESLTNKGISSSELFIEKLFNLEIMLPPYEPNILPYILYKFIRDSELELGEEVIKELEKVIYQKDKSNQYTIIRYLPTFRSVNRFSLQFLQNIKVLKDNEQLKEIYISDLFWLELLQYFDFEAYNYLVFSREDFLILSDGYYTCKELDGKSSKIKEASQNLLEDLFPKEKKPDYSIQVPEFFNSYFAYRLYNNQVSKDSFEWAILESRESFLNLIESNYKTKATSIINLCNLYGLEDKDIDVILNYFEGVFSLFLKSPNLDVAKILEKLLSKNSKNETYHDMFKGKAIDVFKTGIDGGSNVSGIARLLNYLYGRVVTNDYDDFYGHREEKLIVSNSEIESLANDNFKKYLSQKSYIPINFFLNGTSECQFLILNAKESTYFTYNGGGEKKNIDKVLMVKTVMINIINELSESDINCLIEEIFNVKIDQLNYNEEEYKYDVRKLKERICFYFEDVDHYKRVVKEKSGLSMIELDKYFRSID